MKCADLRERLNDLLDGELPAEEEREVRAHVRDCAGCRERHEELSAVIAAVRGIPRPEAPDGFAEEVVAGIPRPRPLARLFWIAPAVAAACLLLLATLTSRPPPLPGPEIAAVTDPAADEKDSAGRSAAAPGALPSEAKEAPGSGKREAGEIGRPAGPLAPRDSSVAAQGESDGRSSPGAEVRLVVRGVEPDSAAGVVLAELAHRRSRGIPARSLSGAADLEDAPEKCRERVESGAAGEPEALVLCVTASELTLVEKLLADRPGALLSLRDGGKLVARDVERRPEPAERLRLRVEFRK